MGTYWTLTRRELGAYFFSLTGYVVIAAAVFLMGFSFVDMLEKLHGEHTTRPVTELFFATPFFWWILLLTAPVITMRLFALEKFSGTYEMLMTAPVRELQVVLAKFSAALVFYTVMWLPLLGCLLVLRHYTSDRSALDYGTLATTFLGILLLGSVFLAIGCCASALTRSQVGAAMMGLAGGTSLFLLAFLADKKATHGNWKVQVLSCFALFDKLYNFVTGTIDTRDVILLLSLTVFFLFLNLRILESRRWK
jgi:ABC-2 type transport system permease protein